MVHPPAKEGSHLRSLSLRGRVLNTRTLAWMLDSLVRVSRRAAYGHYASVRAAARSSVWTGRMAPPAIRRPKGRYLPGAFNRPSKPTLAHPGRSAAATSAT